MHDAGTLSARWATIATGQSTAGHRVLIVDDDAVLCLLNAERLLRSGYQVDTAEDGDAGWEALQSKHYDLLVTDHNMPKVSGVELIKKLRASAQDLPVILVSGALPMEELNRCPWLRLAAILLKPFTGDELLGTVEKVLGEAALPARKSNLPPLAKPLVSPWPSCDEPQARPGSPVTARYSGTAFGKVHQTSHRGDPQ